MARDEVYLRELVGPPGHPFDWVVDVAVHDDEVYLTDFRNRQVKVFDRRPPAGGGPRWNWGGPGGGDGKFGATGAGGPAGLAVHEDEVYVTDLSNNRVQVFNRRGMFLRKWGSPGGGDLQFNTPGRVAVHAQDVYVTDSGNNHVKVFDRCGAFLGKWGETGAGNQQFNGPAGIAVHDGEVYVADRFNRHVKVFDRRGGFLRRWGQVGTGDGEFGGAGQNDGPVGVAVHEDVVYVSDFGNNRVQVFTRSGHFLRKFPPGPGVAAGAGPGQFDKPVGVAVHCNEVYVADRNNNRVQVFDRGSP
jgi:DNA-binding beta-propeller fold protein YncE